MGVSSSHKKRTLNTKRTMIYTIVAQSLIITISIALLGCQKGQDKVSSDSSSIPTGEVNKSVAPAAQQEAPLSLKEEFDKKIRETNNGRKEMNQNECIALANKAIFRYHSDNQYSNPIYLIGDEMIPIKKSPNNKCYVSKPIVLGESLKKFTYSETGAPITRLEEMWSLEKLEGCQLDNYQFTPNCETLVKYTKKSFADDENNLGEITRDEFSIHHKQQINSWKRKDCYLVQGTDSGGCRQFYSQKELKQYREYIASRSSESFAEYNAYQSVQID